MNIGIMYNKGKYRACLYCLLGLLLFLSCQTGQNKNDWGSGQSSIEAQDSGMCQSGEITVWGEAPIFTSLSAAQAKAKQDACRRAVEKCIGEEVASATGVSDGQSILNEIYTQARGICKNDRLIEKQEYKLDTIKMLKAFYRFKVERALVREKINLMQKLIGNPKLMVLIREEYNLPPKKVEGFASRNGLAAKILRESLISKGYSLIDSNKIAKYLKNEQRLAAKPENINEKLKDAAMQAGADLLIVGRVEASKQGLSGLQGTGLKSFRATGSITLLSLWGSGSILGEYSDSQPGAQVTAYSAARSAIETFARGKKRSKLGGMAAYVDKRLKAEWAKATRNNKIEMKIKGLSPEAAGRFRDNLQERTAVKSIDEIESTRKQIRWELTYPGRAFALADTISFYKDNPKVFSVLQRPKCKGPIQVSLVRRGEIQLNFSTQCQ